MAGDVAAFIGQLKSAVGDPYVLGATGPKAFDCSGLIQWAMGQIGYSNFPRTSESQWASKLLVPVDGRALQPGDLIFSQWPGDSSPPGHVAIYVGSGQIIEAANPRAGVHQVALTQDYLGHVMGYRRYIPWSGLTPDQIAAAEKAAGGLATGVANNPLDQAAAGISSVASQLSSLSSFVGKLLLPSTWMRVGAGIVGVLLIGFAVYFFVEEIGADRG